MARWWIVRVKFKSIGTGFYIYEDRGTKKHLSTLPGVKIVCRSKSECQLWVVKKLRSKIRSILDNIEEVVTM